MYKPMDPIDEKDLVPIRDLITRHAGVHFEEGKFYFLEKRVQRRMQATNSNSAREYYRMLTLGEATDELNQLIMAITTNETYFFRNQPQLESFAEEALQEVAQAKREMGIKRLKLWSAACSSGEEAYTLAILLKEHLPDHHGWQIEILATDIDQEVLDKAQMGLYDQRSVKDVTPALLEKYFQEVGDKYQIKNEIRQMVDFKKVNLLDRRGMRLQMEMDFVFCRNVLIYFQEEDRKKVVNLIYDSLRPGGFIFLGHSESVGKLSAAFELVKFNKSLSYRK